MAKTPTTRRMARVQFRIALLNIAARITERGTLRELAKKLHVAPETISAWIRAGEMPPERARQVLMLHGVNPKGQPEIGFGQLAPSFADVI